MNTVTTPKLDLRTHSQILHTELTVLRRSLIDLDAWPEAGDQLLDLIPLSRWDTFPVTDSDFDWLPSVVDDALQGKDIGAKYPAIFQKLLTNDDLRQAFLANLTKRKDIHRILQ
jgi:hypothetical protein